jgi:hypothetical protein
MQRDSFLTYRGLRYFKLAVLLVAVALALALLLPMRHGVSYGGTVFGYVLGTVCALLVLLLAWYGIRKRRPPRIQERRRTDRRRVVAGADDIGDDSRNRRQHDRRHRTAASTWRHGDTLLGWLSAHSYLGGALLVLAALHSGLHFGWNIHTLAFVLLVLTVVSGIWGALAYLRYPRLLADHGDDEGGEVLVDRIAELDELLRLRALQYRDDARQAVAEAGRDSPLVDKMWRRLVGVPQQGPTALAAARIRHLAGKAADEEESALLRDLYALLLRRQRLLERARAELSLKTRLQFWLFLHGPLSIGLLAALVAHVTTILIYW